MTFSQEQLKKNLSDMWLYIEKYEGLTRHYKFVERVNHLYNIGWP